MLRVPIDLNIRHNPSQIMDIEDIIKDFPEKVPRAKYVDKYFFRDSSLVLVHIRQKHRVSKWDDEFYELLAEKNKDLAERVREIEKRWVMNENVDLIHEVQSDIYQFLGFLTEHYNIKDVFCEGISEELLDLYNRYPPDEQKKKDAAVLRLFAEGRINLKATETLETNTLGAAYASLGHLNSKETMDDREQECLEMITKQDQPLAFVVYGGKHDFFPDVKKWNTSHDKKISLIVITTESYNEQRSLIAKLYNRYFRH